MQAFSLCLSPFLFVPARIKELKVWHGLLFYPALSHAAAPWERRITPENHPPLWRFPLVPLSPPAVCVSAIHLSVVSAREWYRELSLLISLHWRGLLQLPCLTRGQRKCGQGGVSWGERGRGEKKTERGEGETREQLKQRQLKKAGERLEPAQDT